MKCALNKEAVKQAIKDEVLNKLDRNLFKVEDSTISLIPQVQSFTAEQNELINKALEYKGEVKGIYAATDALTTVALTFLKEISEQARSSESEKKGAISAVSKELVDIALKVYPKSQAISILENINKEFNSELIKIKSKDTYFIDPSNDLVMNYIIRVEGSGELVHEYLRENYLKQYAPNSLNLMDDDLWRTHPLLQKPSVQALVKLKISPF